MTNVTRYFVRDLDPTNELERGLPCVVRHPDAGGRCERTATIRMYEMLNFCPEHGEEARVGALMELYQDAGYFFDRFRNPHVPDLNNLIERELAAAIVRMNDEGPSDEDYYRALSRAYPDTPEKVRETIRLWERDERANRGTAPAGPPPRLVLHPLQADADRLRGRGGLARRASGAPAPGDGRARRLCLRDRRAPTSRVVRALGNSGRGPYRGSGFLVPGVRAHRRLRGIPARFSRAPSQRTSTAGPRCYKTQVSISETCPSRNVPRRRDLVATRATRSLGGASVLTTVNTLLVLAAVATYLDGGTSLPLDRVVKGDPAPRTVRGAAM